MADVVVKKSKIHGMGAFANRDFKSGEIVVKWNISHQLTAEEVEKLLKSEKRYVAFFKGKYILMQSPAKYVNHSCDANTHSDNFCDVANRNIMKGEEITANYSETMALSESMKCSCGSKNCRAVIKSEK